MGRMVRKQVYLRREQAEAVKQRARELGVTGSELIRRSIEQFHCTPAARARDLNAWQEEIAFARARAALPIAGTGGGRGWTREELYDERPKRWASR